MTKSFKITYINEDPAHVALGQKPVYSISLQGGATELMIPYFEKRHRKKYEMIVEKLNAN